MKSMITVSKNRVDRCYSYVRVCHVNARVCATLSQVYYSTTAVISERYGCEASNKSVLNQTSCRTLNSVQAY